MSAFINSKLSSPIDDSQLFYDPKSNSILKQVNEILKDLGFLTKIFIPTEKPSTDLNVLNKAYTLKEFFVLVNLSCAEKQSLKCRYDITILILDILLTANI
jgi:hypothetical protein